MKWAMGVLEGDVTPNIQTVAPGAYTNPEFFETPPPATKKAPKTATK
jgi:hypothetical protein